MNFRKSLPALVLLTCLFTVTGRAGEPIMPPAPAPTPQTRPQVTEPAPAPPDQEAAQDTLTEGITDIMLSVFTNLLSAL